MNPQNVTEKREKWKRAELIEHPLHLVLGKLNICGLSIKTKQTRSDKAMDSRINCRKISILNVFVSWTYSSQHSMLHITKFNHCIMNE